LDEWEELAVRLLDEDTVIASGVTGAIA